MMGFSRINEGKTMNPLDLAKEIIADAEEKQ